MRGRSSKISRERGVTLRPEGKKVSSLKDGVLDCTRLKVTSLYRARESRELAGWLCPKMAHREKIGPWPLSCTLERCPGGGGWKSASCDVWMEDETRR